METPKIITVKSSRGLSSIIAQNGSIKPQLFRQAVKDGNSDGEYEGEYEGRPFPNSNRFFAPEWDNLRNQWHFRGDNKTFQDVVKDMRLKYPKGHRLADEIIEPGNLEEHIRDFGDPIFKNPALYGKFKIQGGSGSYNMSIPLERFAYYCERDRRDIIDKTQANAKFSDSRRAGARFILESPSQVKVRKAETADNYMNVMEKLIEIRNDEKRLRACCVLLNVPRISERSTLIDLKGALTDTLKESANKPQKDSPYANVGEAFLAYVGMENDTLHYRYVIAVAKKKNLIRTDKGGFRMKVGADLVFIPGPSSMSEIVSYLTSNDDKASEQFGELLTNMKELKYI